MLTYSQALSICLRLLLPLAAESVATEKTRGTLKLYFAAQIASTAATWFGERSLGLSSGAYRAVYVAVTAAILLAAVAVAWQAGARFSWLATVPSSAFFAYFVARGASRSVDFWIVLVEMTVMLVCGFSVGIRFATTRNRNHAILSIMWLIYAIYDAHWLLNVHVSAFEYLCPTYIVTVLCLCVARENWRTIDGQV